MGFTWTKGNKNILSKYSWGQLLQIKKLADKAESAAEKIYPLWSQEDGPGDAFRHLYWSALMTVHLGFAMAKYVGDQHENIEGDYQERVKKGDLHKRTLMDLHNNHVGRQIGLANPRSSDAKLTKECQKAISLGRAKVLLKTKEEADKQGGETL
jgi:hypothetical protein